MRSKTPSLLIAAALFLLAFLLVYQLFLSYRDQIRTAEISTRNLADLLETQLYETLRRTDADLMALSAEIPREALDAAVAPRYRQEINARLASRQINVERMNGLHVHDANGVALYSSLSAPVHAVNIFERAYFQKLRDDPDAGLVFSSVLKSVFSGKDSIIVARGIRDEKGVFLGVILSPLNLETYKQQFTSLDIGRHGFVSLRRSDTHALVVRWPESGEATNTTLAPDHPFVNALATGNGKATIADDLGQEAEGHVNRITSLKSMQGYPFYFAVGACRSEVLAGWYIQVAVVCVSLLTLLGLIGTLLLRLGRMREREAVILTDLAQSENQFSELARLVPAGICHFDTRGRCTFINDRYMAIAGRTRAALLGQDWSAFIHPDDRPMVLDALSRPTQKEGVCICEYRVLKPNGEPVHVIGEIKAERAGDGTVTGYIVAQTDISRLKKVEAELLIAKQQADQANQAKTRFLVAASHDLRQPIQAIHLFKDALNRTGLNEEQKSIARFLSLSVHSLSELLYSLLDISKLDAGLVKPQMRKVEIEEIFKSVDDEFSSLAQQLNLRFKFFYPFNGLVLHTDPGLLLSVLRNLIDNAFKYTKSGGVLVGVRKRGRFGVIQVWDTGIGIDPVFGDKIFEECFQVGNPLKERANGIGIGSSIARRTARLLDGEVVFHSRPGKGTVFEIRIPLADSPHEEVEPVSDTVGSASTNSDEIDCTRFRGCKVVVIEDDPVVAKSIELSLQALDIEVSVFGSAEEAMASPHLLTGDFYISDFILPGMNGIQLLDAIQKKSALPINALLMTGETSPDRVSITSASRWRVVFKPADLSRLLSIMNEVAKAAAPDCD